jgi:hypothetical protein
VSKTVLSIELRVREDCITQLARGGDPLPRARYRAKLRERAGNSVFVWVFGL